MIVNEEGNPLLVLIEEVNVLPNSHGAVNTGLSFYNDGND